MQLCALPVCEDGGSSWVNIDSSDPDVVSGMSTVESIEVVSNVSSDGGRSQTRRSQTGLAGSKRTSPAVSDKDEPRDQNAADGHWAHCAALDCSRLY